MAGDWAISDKAVAIVERSIERNATERGAPPFDYYPTIAWREPGQMWRAEPENEQVVHRAQYCLGLVPRHRLPYGEVLVFIPSNRFGLIIVAPRLSDLESDRRLIDFDGQDIVVR